MDSSLASAARNAYFVCFSLRVWRSGASNCSNFSKCYRCAPAYVLRCLSNGCRTVRAKLRIAVFLRPIEVPCGRPEPSGWSSARGTACRCALACAATRLTSCGCQAHVPAPQAVDFPPWSMFFASFVPECQTAPFLKGQTRSFALWMNRQGVLLARAQDATLQGLQCQTSGARRGAFVQVRVQLRALRSDVLRVVVGVVLEASWVQTKAASASF